MVFGPLPKDSGQIPISSIYIPGGGFVALQGVTPSTDGLGNQSGAVATADVEQAGYVALVSPPTLTNAGTETVLTFSQQVNRVEIYNGTSASLNYTFDTTATAGSLVLPPGYQLDKAKRVTAVHILTAAAVNINGSTAGNIVVLGSL